MSRSHWMSLSAAVIAAACANDLGADKGEPSELGVEGATLGAADHPNNPYRGELTYGTTARGELTRRVPVHYWSFEGTAGDPLFVDLASRAGDDTFLMLFVQVGAGWELVDYNDDCRGSLNSCLEVELTETGRYLVGASSYAYAVRGRPTALRYDLTVHCASESGVCGEPGQGEGETCGGIASLECAAGLRCNYSNNVGCHIADAGGFCEVDEPYVCTREYRPVCGCDGVTYSNDCNRRAAGVALDHEGACRTGGQGVGETCGGIASLECAAGLTCDYSGNVGCDIADVAGVCVEPVEVACIALYRPVCGCDGVTYSNDCHRRAAGVAFAYEGECR